ncbi:MAG: hypothetical protein JO057_00445 [Chloroflexi bacterium]|nr:hypothetical protein [Chloroflexota bacterium]
MSMTLLTFQWVVRVAGILALILGLLFWTGDAPATLVPVHMLLGTLTVLALWLVAVTGSQMGAPMGMVIGAAVLGLLVLALGFSQQSLMPGSGHWVVQVVHLILGMAAIASSEMIGGRVRRAQAAATAS